jgi:hypothetical protein
VWVCGARGAGELQVQGVGLCRATLLWVSAWLSV